MFKKSGIKLFFYCGVFVLYLAVGAYVGTYLIVFRCIGALPVKYFNFKFLCKFFLPIFFEILNEQCCHS
jgi:hypothetical protein